MQRPAANCPAAQVKGSARRGQAQRMGTRGDTRRRPTPRRETTGSRVKPLEVVLDAHTRTVDVHRILAPGNNRVSHGWYLQVDDLHPPVDFGQRLDAMEHFAVLAGKRSQGAQ